VLKSQSAPAGPIEAEIRALVYDWYRKLDVHAPVEEILPALAEDATMVFPESTLSGLDAFKAWYQGGSAGSALPGVINLFFDERHELKRVDIAVNGSGAGKRLTRKATISASTRGSAGPSCPRPKPASRSSRRTSWTRSSRCKVLRRCNGPTRSPGSHG
jgi:hypothetical protein